MEIITCLCRNAYRPDGTPSKRHPTYYHEERAPYASDGARAVRGGRPCPAWRVRKRRGQAWQMLEVTPCEQIGTWGVESEGDCHVWTHYTAKQAQISAHHPTAPRARKAARAGASFVNVSTGRAVYKRVGPRNPVASVKWRPGTLRTPTPEGDSLSEVDRSGSPLR